MQSLNLPAAGHLPTCCIHPAHHSVAQTPLHLTDQPYIPSFFALFYLRPSPDGIGSLPLLRSLTAEGNQLQSIPDSLCKLPKLQTLNLARNQLTQLPAAIGDLPDLSILNVASNHLEALPTSWTRLSKLATLDGSHNAIAALQSSVSRLGQLSDLNLSANKLVAIPQALASCPKLKVGQRRGAWVLRRTRTNTYTHDTVCTCSTWLCVLAITVSAFWWVTKHAGALWVTRQVCAA